jgi:hypothetical protein
MPTDRQIQAARSNGAKSRGPVTARGKEPPPRNAIRYGPFANIVLDGKKKTIFYKLFQWFYGEFQPRTHFEVSLVENMTIARWNQARTCRLHKAAMNHEWISSSPATWKT